MPSESPVRLAVVAGAVTVADACIVQPSEAVTT